MFTTTKANRKSFESVTPFAEITSKIKCTAVLGVESECTESKFRAKVGHSQKTNLPSFLLYREIYASFQSFQGLYVKTRPDFGNI